MAQTRRNHSGGKVEPLLIEQSRKESRRMRVGDLAAVVHLKEPQTE